ncbi:hypothetical protein NX059_009351 [Plenodomus lindquistii]|nr:hypothetical protein NX059_009351 [Plenodomus lindquistii]
MAGNDAKPLDTQKPLPAHFLNPAELLCAPLPDLRISEEAVDRAPAVKCYYDGLLGHWPNFLEDALDFFRDKRTQTTFERCSRVPVYMSSSIEELNGKAMTSELLFQGAEISLSGRFSQNVLAVVTHVVATLTTEEHGKDDHNDFLPKELGFGDAKIIKKSSRVDNQEPDVVLKLPLATENQIRLVGELKFCVTVDLEMMVYQAHVKEETNLFRGILEGQIVAYMRGRRLNYGFISNYNQTVFLKVGLDSTRKHPKIFYSSCISHNVSTLAMGPKDLSVRLAMFYMVFLTSSPSSSGWKMSEATYKATSDWVKVNKSLLPVSSPDGVGRSPSSRIPRPSPNPGLSIPLSSPSPSSILPRVNQPRRSTRNLLSINSQSALPGYGLTMPLHSDTRRPPSRRRPVPQTPVRTKNTSMTADKAKAADMARGTDMVKKQ